MAFSKRQPGGNGSEALILQQLEHLSALIERLRAEHATQIESLRSAIETMRAKLPEEYVPRREIDQRFSEVRDGRLELHTRVAKLEGTLDETKEKGDQQRSHIDERAIATGIFVIGLIVNSALAIILHFWH